MKNVVTCEPTPQNLEDCLHELTQSYLLNCMMKGVGVSEGLATLVSAYMGECVKVCCMASLEMSKEDRSGYKAVLQKSFYKRLNQGLSMVEKMQP